MYTAKNLFIATFLFIISTYLYIFGQNQTIKILQLQNYYILALLILSIIFLYFKYYIKSSALINEELKKVPLMPLKQSMGFFIFFSLFDFYYENGFEGMIKQWIIYWILGLISFLVLNLINQYKSYILIKNRD